MPFLTPEYLGGIPAFTRRYFEELSNRLSSPTGKKRDNSLKNIDRPHYRTTIIVFDNYQEASRSSLFHEMLVNGLKVIPAWIRMIIISGNKPPPQFSRLKANCVMSFIGWNEIRFTLEETR